MIGYVGNHRANDAKVVRVLANVPEELTDIDAAFSILFESERRTEGRAGWPFSNQIWRGQLLAVVLGQQWFRIKGVDM